MRRLIFVSITAVALGGCSEGTSPYLIADTLRLNEGRPREDLGRVLQRILVVRDDNGTNHRMESEHVFTIENGVLTYDSCPRDALCIASLVYAPLAFQIVGDSLFQISSQGSPLPGAVYGALGRR